jgi:hypothetical protein
MSDPTPYPLDADPSLPFPEFLAAVRAGGWRTSVSQSGDSIHVSPVCGLVATGNWALNPYHRRGIGNFCAQMWRMWSGAYIRREYPKSERALRKAVAECDIWCERETTAAERSSAIVAAVTERPARE